MTALISGLADLNAVRLSGPGDPPKQWLEAMDDVAWCRSHVLLLETFLLLDSSLNYYFTVHLLLFPFSCLSRWCCEVAVKDGTC